MQCTKKRIDMEGTGRTPRPHSEADVLSQQSSFRVVQLLMFSACECVHVCFYSL